MKNLILILAITILGCSPPSSEPKPKIVGNELRFGNESYLMREFEYDGCEYIAFGKGNYFAVTHKGNCKYCQGRNK